MITLRLTLPELQQLRHLLADQANAEHNLLLAKLDHAHHQATALRICPICTQSFTQLKVGRTANYCSAACKQKAYRKRRDEALRTCPFPSLPALTHSHTIANCVDQPFRCTASVHRSCSSSGIKEQGGCLLLPSLIAISV